MIVKMSPQDVNMELSTQNIKEIRVLSEIPIKFFLSYLHEKFDCYVYKDKAVTKAIFGVNDEGECFLFFGNIKKLPLSFYKESKIFCRDIISEYGPIKSTILQENTFAINFAKFLNAVFSKPYIKKGKTFVDYEIR